MQNLEKMISSTWDDKDRFDKDDHFRIITQKSVQDVLNALDQGFLRVAEKKDGVWITHEWIKKAILLSFCLGNNTIFQHGFFMSDSSSEAKNLDYRWYDKVPLKMCGWDNDRFQKSGFRAVPGAIVRHSAYIAPQVVLMPSFVNVGAYVDEGTMVDSWCTVGSCAQIGRNCHLSTGVGIGGVLEPLQANPVIIEDNCFIGASSQIVEGVIVEEGAVIAMGVFLGASTKIVDRITGHVHYGRVPAYSVIVPGTLPGKTPDLPHIACAVITKQVDAKTRSKTAINELLRD